MSHSLQVTFDTNTLAPLVTAYLQENAAMLASKPETVILSAIQNGVILPRAAETVLTLEGVQRKDRVVYFGGYGAGVSVSKSAGPKGGIKMGFTIGTGATAPSINQGQLDRMNAFVALGGRFMLIPRIGGVPAPQTMMKDLVLETSDEQKIRQKRSFELVRIIEKAGAGIHEAKTLAERLEPGKVPWVNAFAKTITPQDEIAVGDAIAEWADGDMIAAHYGYDNDVFCTNDRAKGAGSSSVMSAKNWAWLTSDYGVRFMTLEELAQSKLWRP